jgi:preprotein translocase subunit SecG
MFTILLFLHILVAVSLVIVILLQSGTGAAISGAFGGGGGGNQTLFGGRGAATFFSKATTYLGAAFLVVSLVLAYVQAHQSAAGVGGRNIIRESLRPTQAAPAPGADGGAAPSGAPAESPIGTPSPVPAGGTGSGQ